MQPPCLGDQGSRKDKVGCAKIFEQGDDWQRFYGIRFIDWVPVYASGPSVRLCLEAQSASSSRFDTPILLYMAVK